VIFIVGLGRFFVFRRRLVALLLFLHFLLLALLHFLLLLIMFALHLLELLLLPLLRLLLALLVLLLLELLVLLNLFLFELLALLILLLAKLVELLLLTLLDLRIHARPRARWPVIAVVIAAIVRLGLRLVGLRVWAVIVWLRLLRRGLILLGRPIIWLRFSRWLILLRRAIVVRLRLSGRLVLLNRTIVVWLRLPGWLILLRTADILRSLRLVLLARAIVYVLALRRQLSRPCILHHADVVAGSVVLAILRSRDGTAAVGLHLLQLAINRRGRRRRRGLGDHLASHDVSRRPHPSLLR